MLELRGRLLKWNLQLPARVQYSQPEYDNDKYSMAQYAANQATKQR
jgi:hypothetical protein